MIEVKAKDDIPTYEVQEKGLAGVEFCRTVSEWNAQNGGKPWEYAIVADSGIQPNSSFKYSIYT
jgi:type III restriction enzyme